MSLIWRVFVINAGLVVGATLLLAITPATVSAELSASEVAVLASGVVGVLVLNFALIRRSLDPLERLTRLMHRVDLLRPGARIALEGGGREVTELAAAFDQMLERLELERRESGRRAIEALEQERRRVALELHDEVGQLLTGVVLGLDGLQRSVPREVRGQVTDLQDMVRQGVEQVREIARGLRPESLEELGLRSALVGLTSAVTSRTGLRVTRRVMSDLPPLSPDVELVVYRVAQESLTNVVRHAGATRVELRLERRGDGLELCVSDDGRGIGLDPAGYGGGLAGMRERALSIGGRLEVGRTVPQGTTVRLHVPLGAPQR